MQDIIDCKVKKFNKIGMMGRMGKRILPILPIIPILLIFFNICDQMRLAFLCVSASLCLCVELFAKTVPGIGLDQENLT